MLRSKRCKLLSGFLMVVSLSAWAFADPMIIAHRGNLLFYPENTIESINGSGGFADSVNVDVRTTQDGVLVLIRDATVDRTTNGSGNVADFTLANLQALDAGSKFDALFAGAKIPTLAEGMAAAKAKNMKLLLDIRGATAADIYSTISAANAFNDVAIQAQDLTIIEELRSLDTGSQLKLGVLGLGVTPDEAFLDDAKSKGASFVTLDNSLVDAAAVTLIKSKNLDVYLYTLNGVTIQRKVDQVNMDGLITDDPKLAHAVLGRSNRTNLNDRLIAHWKMDDGQSGTPSSVLDSVNLNSDGASNGTPSNNPAWTTGKFGGAVSFASDSTTVQSVQIPTSPALNPGTNALTMSMWVRFDQLTADFGTAKTYGAIYNSNATGAFYNPANGQDYYIFYQDKTVNGFRFKVSNVNADNTGVITGRATVLDSDLVKNEWLHIVGVYDGNWSGRGGELHVYVNGKLRAMRAGQESPALPSGVTNKGLIGLVPDGQIAAFGAKGATATTAANAQYFNGGIDDAAIWKRALTTSDVKYIYDQGMASRSLADILPTSAVGTWSLY